MTHIVELEPELEERLRERAGSDPARFIRDALREKLERETAAPAASGAALSARETALLQRINRGLPPETWQRYRALVQRRRAETLTPDEHAELIALSDEVEAMNARRIRHLAELAALRGTTLDAVMEQLGIKAPPVE